MSAMTSTNITAASVATASDRPRRAPEAFWPALIALSYFAVAIHSAYMRPFWFDELSTLFVVTTPSWRAMSHAIPLDGNPPLYFVLARLTMHLPVRAELALRLPAIFAYFASGAAIYYFVRRNLSSLYACLAVCFFLCSSMNGYAIEARAYSLLMAFTGLTICAWQSYSRAPRPQMLALIFIGITGAILSNHYGVVYGLFPLLAAEAVRSVRRQILDYRLLATAFCGATLTAITFPPMLRAQHPLLSAIPKCPGFSVHPHWSDLEVYAQLAPSIFPVLIGVALTAFLVIVALYEAPPPQPAPSIPPDEIACAAALALLLPVMLVATHFGTTFFQPRYAIGASMGIAILSAFAFAQLSARWARGRDAARVAAGYALVLGLIVLTFESKLYATPIWRDPILNAGNPQEQIVIADGLSYSPMWWYSTPQMRSRLHYLEDLPYAIQHSDLIPEYSIALEHSFTPIQMDDYHAFLAAHPRFLLYCFSRPHLEWTKQRLTTEGWHLTLLRSAKRPKGRNETGQPHRELYEVSR